MLKEQTEFPYNYEVSYSSSDNFLKFDKQVLQVQKPVGQEARVEQEKYLFMYSIFILFLIQ